MSKKPKKITVYAFGFDKIGFQLPATGYDCDTFVVRFLDYRTDKSLDEADGLVIPSGIFEELYTDQDSYGYNRRRVRYDKLGLAEREKQLINARKAGKWVVFALGAVSTGPAQDWTDTDLAKKILHVFASNVEAVDPTPYIECKSDEFKKYLDRFGVVQTKFTPSGADSKPRTLVESHDRCAGMEIWGDFFFLPFFSNKREASVLSRAVVELVTAVLDYKRKNDFYLPAWLENLEFKTEARISAEIQAAEKRLITLTEDAKKWLRYKGILCTSGRNLNEIVVEVLRDFFQCKLQSEEKYVEDAIIYDATDKPAFVVEIKGVNGGLKREHVNQVDSHRERLELDSSVSGLLIINDFMDIEDLDTRKAKTFDTQHLSHAMNNNIRVLRTTTLIEIMLELEDSDKRSTAFLALCSSGSPLVTG